MHLHESPGNVRGAARPLPRSRASAPAGAAERLLFLQRSIGNAATRHLVQRAIDDADVHRVLRSAGRPLSTPVREEMEARFDADFRDVRLHTDPVAQRSAAGVGAAAYTSGSHVVVGRGGIDPHTLAHELTHVLQQREGPVDGTDTGNGFALSRPDDRFEREAEANAHHVLQTVPARQVPDDRSSAPPPRPRPGTRAVQRMLQLGEQNLTAAYKAGMMGHANTVWNRITFLPRFQERAPDVQRKMEAQYWKWVEDEPGKSGPKSHPTWGRKQQHRVYEKIDDLEMALYGWVAAKPGRHLEKEAAKLFYRSPEAELRLNKVLTLLLDKIENLHRDHPAVDPERQEEILDDLTWNNVPMPPEGEAKPRGTYQGYLYFEAKKKGKDIATRIEDGFLDVLRNPETYSLYDKVVAVHDLMEYFGPQNSRLPQGWGYGLLPPPTEEHVQATIDIVDGLRRTQLTRGRREDEAHQATRDEQDPSTRFARAHGLPVWSGHSNSTARVMQLGRWVEASDDDLTSLAHALFAFWRLSYDHSYVLAPHTLHEVMDFAQNFGVPYDPLDRYSTFRRYEDRAGEQNRLKAEIDGMTERMQERWASAGQLVEHVGPNLDGGKSRRIENLVSDGRSELQALATLDQRFSTAGPDKRVEILRDMLRINNVVRQHVNEIRNLIE